MADYLNVACTLSLWSFLLCRAPVNDTLETISHSSIVYSIKNAACILISQAHLNVAGLAGIYSALAVSQIKSYIWYFFQFDTFRVEVDIGLHLCNYRPGIFSYWRLINCQVIQCSVKKPVQSSKNVDCIAALVSNSAWQVHRSKIRLSPLRKDHTPRQNNTGNHLHTYLAMRNK